VNRRLLNVISLTFNRVSKYIPEFFCVRTDCRYIGVWNCVSFRSSSRPGRAVDSTLIDICLGFVLGGGAIQERTIILRTVIEVVSVPHRMDQTRRNC